MIGQKRNEQEYDGASTGGHQSFACFFSEVEGKDTGQYDPAEKNIAQQLRILGDKWKKQYQNQQAHQQNNVVSQEAVGWYTALQPSHAKAYSRL